MASQEEPGSELWACTGRWAAPGPRPGASAVVGGRVSCIIRLNCRGRLVLAAWSVGRRAACRPAESWSPMAGRFAGDIRLFGVTLAAIFVAELGDKTQLTALAFSASAPGYRLLVFAATAAAMVLSSLIGVLAGGLLARVVKPRVLNVVAGVIFIVCAVLFAVRFAMAGDAGSASVVAVGQGDRTPWEAFAFTFVAIFVAELGDKTQLATLSLAAGNRHARWVVFAGSATALTAASALACLLGGVLGEHLESRYLSLAAAAIFAVLGLFFLLGRAEKGRREFAWLVKQIEQLYEDEQCRTCPRLMAFLEHVRAIGSSAVSQQVDRLLRPRSEWQTHGCDRPCRVDGLHRRWHERYEHEDEVPLEKE